MTEAEQRSQAEASVRDSAEESGTESVPERQGPQPDIPEHFTKRTAFVLFALGFHI